MAPTAAAGGAAGQGAVRASAAAQARREAAGGRSRCARGAGGPAPAVAPAAPAPAGGAADAIRAACHRRPRAGRLMRRVLILNLLLLAIVGVLVVQIVALFWWSEPEAEAVGAARGQDAEGRHSRRSTGDRRPPNLATQIADKDLFDQSRTAGRPRAPPWRPRRPSRCGR